MKQTQRYITQRVIDAFLREDIRGILSQGEWLNASAMAHHWPHDTPTSWLKISHLGDFRLYLPVKDSGFIQPWVSQGATWLFERDNQFTTYEHYDQWLAQMAVGLTANEKQLYAQYQQECLCACEQQAQAQLLFAQQQANLSQPIASLNSGWQQMSLIEQLAAHCDHPLYPTARAKFGLAADAIAHYCPEAMGQFELNWLAVPKALCNNAQLPLPSEWPSFGDVGLSESLAASHQLVPVHPLTLNEYLGETLQNWPHLAQMHIAPQPFMSVRPTLSVRTVAMVEHPEVHIKLPLPMRTLGSKNIRTIKPSTINDGYVFQQLLQHLEANDDQLNGLYLHCDEQSGGDVDARADLAWLLRRYPAQTAQTTPVCVAAFLAQTPDGKTVIEQLAQSHYHGGLNTLLVDYFALLIKVHVRLCLRYGIALESNQQNTLVLFSRGRPLQLLFRDNDAGRIDPTKLSQQLTGADDWLTRFIDRRIAVDDPKALVQMFTTINLQLNIGCIIDGLAKRNLVDSHQQYVTLNQLFEQNLSALEDEGVDTGLFRQMVLAAPCHWAKYLLSAASLMSKQQSQAADINKFYGLSAPNPLRAARS